MLISEDGLKKENDPKIKKEDNLKTMVISKLWLHKWRLPIDEDKLNKYEVLIDAYVQSYAKLCKASECKAEIVQR